MRQAAEAGVQEAREWLETGIEPSPPAFVPMPPFSPPPGFIRGGVGAPMSVMLSMQPLATFGLDAKGHLHKGKGPGGGQFTGQPGGEGKGKQKVRRRGKKEPLPLTGKHKEIVVSFDQQYPKAGDTVDGRKVLPITEAINPGKDLTDYYILPGVREFSLDAIDKDRYYAASESNVDSLVEKITESNGVTPVEVVMFSTGPQIGEGNHRIAALKKLGAKSFPAIVILDMGDLTTDDPIKS